MKSPCWKAVLALTIVGVLSCAQSTRCDETTGACAGSAASVVAVGDDVVLTPGKTVQVGTDGVRLSFESISSDSRCPTDVQCVWAGNAAARVRVWVGTSARLVDINSMVDPKQAQVDGYLLRFVALTPDPVSTTKIDPAAYRLTVRVERAN